MEPRSLSTQFDDRARADSPRVLEMGGMVESQVARAVDAFVTSAARSRQRCSIADDSASTDWRSSIDRDLSSHHRAPPADRARPAPADRDHEDDRPTSSASATRRARSRAAAAAARTRAATRCVCRVNDLALFRRAGDLDAAQGARRVRAARSQAAAAIAQADDQASTRSSAAILRKLITFMMEDPRTISSASTSVLVAKAIERIGDHAKNIAEHIIYIVKGTDVRHTPVGRSRARHCAQG